MKLTWRVTWNYVVSLIKDPGDLDGWSEIKDEDKQVILALIRDTAAEKNKDGPKKSKKFSITLIWHNKRDFYKRFVQSNFLS